jgi:hypothetical protein
MESTTLHDGQWEEEKRKKWELATEIKNRRKVKQDCTRA